MDQLISLWANYHIYIMGVAAVLALVLPKGSIGDNKPMLIIAILLGLSIIYELAMDEPVTQLPSRINRTMNQPGPSEKTNPKYWVPPEERYDKKEHEEMKK
jgi:hypothetical protein